MLAYRFASRKWTDLYLTVNATGTITGRTNVILSPLDVNSKNQVWIPSKSTVKEVELATENNPLYMLNARTTTWNCDVYTSNSDTVLDFTSVSGSLPYYRITLHDHPERYLTAYETDSGINAEWRLLDDCEISAQFWQLSTVSLPDPAPGKAIPFPNGRSCLWNQKDPLVVETIDSEYGCTIICGLNAANFYGPKNYTIQDIASQWKPGTGYTWRFPSGCAGQLNGAKVESDYAVLRAKIVEQINLGDGRPMLIRISGYGSDGKIHYHSVVAYGYTNNAATNADILVIDPYNPDSKTVARKTTLAVINKTRPTLENYRTTQPITA